LSLEIAFTHFVEPMQRRFAVSRDMPREAFLEDCAAELARFSVVQLDGAVQWFTRNHKQRTFPSIGDCIDTVARMPTEKHIEVARKAYDREANRKADEAVEFRRRIEAYKLCRCAMGREADHNGWLPALIEFCEDNQRLPAGHEIDDVKAKAQRSADALESLLKGMKEGGSLYAACAQFRRNMLDRAHTEVFDYRPKMTEAA
jgi:hypothetical protein